VKNDLLYVLIDDPPVFGPMEALEQYLADLQAMPDFLGKASTIKRTKWYMARLKRSLHPAQLSFQFLTHLGTGQQGNMKISLAAHPVEVNRPVNGTTYQPAEGEELHPGDAGVVWGRTAQDAGRAQERSDRASEGKQAPPETPARPRSRRYTEGKFSVTKILPPILMDDPSIFDTPETLERYLADLQARPNFMGKDQAVQFAKRTIAMKKRIDQAHAAKMTAASKTKA
jgi:hypothetical protein